MKSIIAIATIGALALGLASQANAASLYKLSPIGKFTASGATTLSGPAGTLSCTSTFSGTVNKYVTGFSAVGDAGCSSLVATLPWPAQAINATTIAFKKVTVGIPGFFTCGGLTQKTNVTDDANGLVGFNTSLNGGCTTSGSVQTLPKVLIVHK